MKKCKSVDKFPKKITKEQTLKIIKSLVKNNFLYYNMLTATQEQLIIQEMMTHQLEKRIKSLEERWTR